MIRILMFLLILNSCSVFCQQVQYFQTIYPQDTVILKAHALEILSDGYLLYGNYAVADNVLSHCVWKISNAGETEYLNPYRVGPGLSAILGPGQLIKKDDQSLYVCFGQDSIREDGTTVIMSQIHEIDPYGNTLQSFCFGDTSRYLNAPKALHQLDDESLLVLGYQSTDDNQSREWVLRRITKDGELLWRKVYALDGGDGVPFTITPVGDSEFLITGFGEKPLYDYQSYVIKVDSAGDLQWQRDFGTNGIESSGYLKELDDGNLILAYGSVVEMKIRKLNPLGQTLSTTNYDCGYYNGGTSPIVEVAANRYVTVFRCQTTVSSHNYGLLACLDDNADIVWTKPLSSDPEGDVYVRELEGTEDGGFILAGFRQYPTPQYTWVAKFDSLGNTCWQADCDSLGGYPVSSNGPRADRIVSMSPNPATNHVAISGLTSDQLYPVVCKVYDLQGHLVLEASVSALRRDFDLDISALSSGLYVCELSSGGRVLFGERLVVDR